MPLRVLDNPRKEYQGYMPLEILVGSGAAASVIPERLLQGYEVRQGEAARRGVNYLVADGGSVPNLGEMSVNLITQERHKCNILFQVADVNKPILAVSSLAAHGHSVSFNDKGGTIKHMATGRITRFRKGPGRVCLEGAGGAPTGRKGRICGVF